MTVEMHAQPKDRSCTNEAIGGNHYGPVIVYMSQVSDATTNVGDGKWFKVDQDGYDATTKIWGTVSLSPSIIILNLPSAGFVFSLQFELAF